MKGLKYALLLIILGTYSLALEIGIPEDSQIIIPIPEPIKINISPEPILIGVNITPKVKNIKIDPGEINVSNKKVSVNISYSTNNEELPSVQIISDVNIIDPDEVKDEKKTIEHIAKPVQGVKENPSIKDHVKVLIGMLKRIPAFIKSIL